MRLYLACLFVPLILAFGMNYWLDASGLESSALVARLAREQGRGDILVSDTQFDWRAWARTRLLSGPCPDVLVFGSSTVGDFSEDMFPGKVLLNAWMGGPTVEDFEAMTSVLRRSKCHPRTMVVGVDPWWIGNPTVTDRRWMSMLDDYLAFEPQRGWASTLALELTVGWARFEDRMSFETTRESFGLLLARFRAAQRGPHLLRATEAEICASEKLAMYDRVASGNEFYCPAWIPAEGERKRIAERYLANNMHSMASWRDIAWNRIARLRRLLSEWSRDGSAVVLVGMPYHPITFDLLRSNPVLRSNLDLVDGALTQMQGNGIRFVDLRDPASVPCAEEEFRDSHHSMPSCGRKVTARLIDAGDARARQIGQ
jgi:hypothetical protein